MELLINSILFSAIYFGTFYSFTRLMANRDVSKNIFMYRFRDFMANNALLFMTGFPLTILLSWSFNTTSILAAAAIVIIISTTTSLVYALYGAIYKPFVFYKHARYKNLRIICMQTGELELTFMFTHLSQKEKCVHVKTTYDTVSDFEKATDLVTEESLKYLLEQSYLEESDE